MSELLPRDFGPEFPRVCKIDTFGLIWLRMYVAPMPDVRREDKVNDPDVNQDIYDHDL